jgi:hypothetical protein
MSRVIILLARKKNFCLWVFFLDQERKIPGNPKILEVFLSRKCLICKSQDSWLVMGSKVNKNKAKVRKVKLIKLKSLKK